MDCPISAVGNARLLARSGKKLALFGMYPETFVFLKVSDPRQVRNRKKDGDDGIKAGKKEGRS